MGSVRWAFRCGSWTPSRSEWLFAARCVQREEKDRIGQFVFAKDAKSAMAGRLLLRKFVCERMGIPWSQVRLERSPRGKPCLADTVNPHTFCFNISHQGDYAVLAAQQGAQVGVDVMKTTMPGSSSIPEFFRIMTRQFTAHEWSTIQSAGSEHRQLAAFYRHWVSTATILPFTGLTQRDGRLFSLTLTGNFQSCHLCACADVCVCVPPQESLLDADHHVAVAWKKRLMSFLCLPSQPLPPPATFTPLSFGELIASASPLSEEDPAYWDSFSMKAEAPQRQRDAWISG
uniref:L-aminoadipate-semialdehyde dehydrogenase-phosphopantetheinyl transferase n=1 Tax=Fundulus heteroclitus TaxID=8078 RepID=A0A3Q2NUJ7_FUNHE